MLGHEDHYAQSLELYNAQIPSVQYFSECHIPAALGSPMGFLRTQPSGLRGQDLWEWAFAIWILTVMFNMTSFRKH